MAKIRILIADDNADYSFMLSSVLAHVEGFEISGTVSTGREAIQKIYTLKPDVVLLDIVMPEMDGLEVLAAVNQMDREKPYVIVITAIGTEEIIRRCQAMHIGDFLIKPVEISTIAAKIKEKFAAVASEDQKINLLLHKMKIPANILGFKYLRDLVLLYYKNRSDDFYALSQEAARAYPVDYILFRRSIRYAISIAWDMDNGKDKDSIFYQYKTENRSRPTVYRMVVLLASKLDQ